MFTQVMGLLVFVAGLIMLVVSVVDTLIPSGIGNLERLVLFGGGVVTCLIGYFMASSGDR